MRKDMLKRTTERSHSITLSKGAKLKNPEGYDAAVAGLRKAPQAGLEPGTHPEQKKQKATAAPKTKPLALQDASEMSTAEKAERAAKQTKAEWSTEARKTVGIIQAKTSIFVSASHTGAII